MISKRAKELLSHSSPIVKYAAVCAEDPFSRENLGGYLNFGTAQNFLMEDEIINYVRSHHSFEKSDIHYNALHGKNSLRSAFADFAKEFMGTPNLDIDAISVQCGVSAICESLAFCLFDEGDSLIMAAPYYPGFAYDFKERFKVDVQTVPLKKENQFKHNFEDFKKQIELVRPKAILLTNPYNPTGEVLSTKFQDQIVELCQRKKIHLIADEIYALSKIDGEKHQSFLNYDYENIHLLYGMAKDFSLAGMKLGFFYSRNKKLAQAMIEISYFHTVSTETQNSVEALLKDHDYIRTYKKTYQERLKGALDYLIEKLPDLSFVYPSGGFFVLLDLQKYLTEKTTQAEMQLFFKLLNDYKINLNPGSTMGFDEPGYFRLCYAKEKYELDEFILRFETYAKRSQ
jgi:aspartate/methionine/tyrosine aminotransferase